MSTDAAPAGHHWLIEWMAEYEVVDPTSARDRLSYSGPIGRLHELATQPPRATPTAPIPAHLNAVVASHGFEIGSRSACLHPDCRSAIIQYDLARLLYISDYLVMEGPSPFIYASIIEGISNDEEFNTLAKRVESDVATLLEMRRIGLTDCTFFRYRPERYCRTHSLVHADTLGLSHLANEEIVTSLVDQIMHEGNARIAGEPHHWVGSVSHPLLDGMPTVRSYSQKDRPDEREHVDQTVAHLLSIMLSDVGAARELGLPLAASVRQGFFDGYSGVTSSPTVDDVAVRMSIPTLANISVENLLKLKNELPDEFSAFRASLREAIREANVHMGDKDPSTIAQHVEESYLRPAMVDLVRRAKTSKVSLYRKIGAGLAVGTATTAVGALAAIPVLIGAGVAIAATPLAQINEYFDDRREFELSEMYFLWRSLRASD